MIAALIGQDQEAFELHEAVARAGATVKALHAEHPVDHAKLRAAEESFFNARAQLHEKCALEAA